MGAGRGSGETSHYMRVAILEDYQKASLALACFAALDVFENEPILAPGHPLAALPNVTATPHLGFVERGNYEKYVGDAFDAVNAFASGKPVRVVPWPQDRQR